MNDAYPAKLAQALIDDLAAAGYVVVGAKRLREVYDRVDRLTTQRDAVLALHRDAGPGMGHDTPSGDYYGDFPTSCTACGTSDEYAVAWPCPTARALGVDGA